MQPKNVEGGSLMHFAICDDDREYISILQSFFEGHQELNIETEPYESGEELLKDYQEGKRYDAIFIDMEMTGMNGIETGDAIRDIDDRVIIVFVTAHEKYITESFKCEPLRFILKPIKTGSPSEIGTLEEALNACCSRILKKRETFSFKFDGDQIRLYCDEIIYCESADHQIIIHTKDQKYYLRGSLNELEDILQPDMFCRVHKSFLINLLYVLMISYKRNEISLRNCDTIIPIGRTYKKLLIQAYNSFEARRLCI